MHEQNEQPAREEERFDPPWVKHRVLFLRCVIYSGFLANGVVGWYIASFPLRGQSIPGSALVLVPGIGISFGLLRTGMASVDDSQADRRRLGVYMCLAGMIIGFLGLARLIEM